MKKSIFHCRILHTSSDHSLLSPCGNNKLATPPPLLLVGLHLCKVQAQGRWKFLGSTGPNPNILAQDLQTQKLRDTEVNSRRTEIYNKVYNLTLFGSLLPDKQKDLGYLQDIGLCGILIQMLKGYTPGQVDNDCHYFMSKTACQNNKKSQNSYPM